MNGSSFDRLRMNAIMPTALTIAGSDPSGGAGIQADLKTFETFGVTGLSAITAITAQTTDKVFSVNPVAADILTQQLSAVAKDKKIDAIKIGMIGSAANVQAIILFLRSVKAPHIIIDPVFTSTSGMPLLESHALQVFKEELLPLTTLVTPNLDEAGVLTGMRIWNVGTMKEAARQIYSAWKVSVLVKGGHLSGNAIDVLFDGVNFTEFSAKRIAGNKHGTGCRLSSAITASLALGGDLPGAILTAKKFVEDYIKSL